MTHKDFDNFQEKLLAEVTAMGQTKGKEYASETDRFDNFNQDAADNDIDRLKAANIFLNKHMRAIKSYIRKGQTYSNEPIRGRIVDAITYLTLIAGMIEESELIENKREEVVLENKEHLKCSVCNIEFINNDEIFRLTSGKIGHKECLKSKEVSKT